MLCKFTRLYSDADGESHFEDVDAELTLVDFAPNAPPLKVSEYISAERTAFLGGPSGWNGDWHVSSARNLFVVISGEWEIEASDGQTRSFTTSSVLLVEDTTGKGHRSRVVGEDDSLALLVQLAGET
jgi:hypothetical protein